METTVLDPRQPLKDQLAWIAKAHDRLFRPGEVWLSVDDPGTSRPEHGWKIHVSARPGTLYQTLERVLPVLLGNRCDFKLTSSPDVLRAMNGTLNRPGAAGKAVTVYPPQDDVVRIAGDLAEATFGMPGPRVRSDRRVRAGSPVYYRYGPFLPRWRSAGNGELELVMVGPDGTVVAGTAGEGFRCPPWAQDPFVHPIPAQASGGVPAAGPAQIWNDSTPGLLGGRFRLTAVLLPAARGNVYRAVDTRTGARVVVKEARAYIGEDASGLDVRANLRNERRVLAALDGLAGVPQLVDHFHHGEDEFLAVASMGETDLRRDVADHGPYRGAHGSRSLAGLAAELLALLDAVHSKGVVARDFAPKNVVLGDHGRCALVDFDISGLDGMHRYGYTPGYSPPEQPADVPASPADDYYALGATLFYAVTGMDPVRVDANPERNVAATLATLRAVLPTDPLTTALIGQLLGPAGGRAAATARIRSGRFAPPTTGAGEAPRLPAPVTAADLDGIVTHTVAEVLRDAERLGEPADRPPAAGVYLGLAGPLLELLHHTERDEVRARLGVLARLTAEALPRADPPPGLLFGSTGAAIAVRAAGHLLGDERLAAEGAQLARVKDADLTVVDRDDYVSGLAGLGVGRLITAAAWGESRHLEVAAECARRIVAGEVAATADHLPAPRPGDATATPWAFAHGVAGVAYFLLSYATATGDVTAGEAARWRFDELARAVPDQVAAVALPSARPMSASWCQGLAGIGAGLVRAARLLGDDRYLEVARNAAAACLAMAPRMPIVSQCCGLAGVGELLVDLGIATGEPAFFDQAGSVLSLILTRCGGDPQRPVFPDNTLVGSSAQWAVGSAGVLSFLRRLRDRAGERVLMADWRPPGTAVAAGVTATEVLAAGHRSHAGV